MNSTLEFPVWKNIFHGIESSFFVVAHMKIAKIKKSIWTNLHEFWVKTLNLPRCQFFGGFKIFTCFSYLFKWQKFTNTVHKYLRFLCFSSIAAKKCFWPNLSSNKSKTIINNNGKLPTNQLQPICRSNQRISLRSPFRITRALELVFLVGQGDLPAQQVWNVDVSLCWCFKQPTGWGCWGLWFDAYVLYESNGKHRWFKCIFRVARGCNLWCVFVVWDST